MFVDELTITAKAGDGGNGVVRWRKEKFIPKGGPSGGDGGRGGDIYMRAVRDIGLLAKYTGSKEFVAENGNSGEKKSKHGKDGEDVYIDVPMGSMVHDIERDRTYSFFEEGEIHKILKGGRGGLGNEHFKSSTNQTPQESTEGKRGERGAFHIELSLIVDGGLIGLPNAGKSTLINKLTNANARVGAYPFTTLEPQLGSLYGYILADIPGLIEGASEGRGLGHTFLKHITRTKALLHCVSLEYDNPYSYYEIVRNELKKYDESLLHKEEWIVLTKADLVTSDHTQECAQQFMDRGKKVYIVSSETEDGIKELRDALMRVLRTK